MKKFDHGEFMNRFRKNYRKMIGINGDIMLLSCSIGLLMEKIDDDDDDDDNNNVYMCVYLKYFHSLGLIFEIYNPEIVEYFQLLCMCCKY